MSVGYIRRTPPTERERAFLIRCGLAEHHTSPSVSLQPPMTYDEIRETILAGWVVWRSGYRLLRAGEKLVRGELADLLAGGVLGSVSGTSAT